MRLLAFTESAAKIEPYSLAHGLRVESRAVSGLSL